VICTSFFYFFIDFEKLGEVADQKELAFLGCRALYIMPTTRIRLRIK
jgi:hypothetical protein